MNRNKNYLIFVIFLLAVCFSLIIFGAARIINVSTFGKSVISSAAGNVESTDENTDDIFDELNSLFFGEKPQPLNQKVYLGGKALGLSFDGDGALVIGINEFLSKGGLVSPAVESGINIGDTVIELNGKSIHNSAMLNKLLQEIGEKSVKIKLKRGVLTMELNITPRFDIVSKTYKLGLWVKDASSGIGMLTFVRSDGKFACLGHPVVDSKTGAIIPINGGNVYTCKILSIERGIKGKAGEVRGVIDCENRIGKLKSNNPYGVYGEFTEGIDSVKGKSVEVASAAMVKPGKAKILCALDGVEPKEYDIEIIKAVYQNGIADKGMVIRVVDKDLLELTGGIVQGMSGSPIIQNGRLVGAVTHVFVNDPTKGYGIYVEWMLKTLDEVCAVQENSDLKAA
jgi:stage IV sporulation protein B